MASKGVNKVILVGNLGKDPEVRYMPSGGAVANFSIATSESWKDKNTGEPKEKTEWHNISVFGKLAEIAGEYLRKGSQVYVEGALQTRKWQDQNGNDRYSTDVVLNGFDCKMQMLGGRGENQVGGQQQQQGGYNQAPQQPSPQQQPMQQGQQQQAKAPSLDEGWGEDIPF